MCCTGVEKRYSEATALAGRAEQEAVAQEARLRAAREACAQAQRDEAAARAQASEAASNTRELQQRKDVAALATARADKRLQEVQEAIAQVRHRWNYLAAWLSLLGSRLC